jgi:hypothetical protein
MKKVFFTSLFLASAAMGLSSCMNGDYDANPNAVSSAPNPLNNNNGGSGGSGGGGGSTGGTITCKVDGTNYTFTQATYNVIGSMYTIAGGNSDGTNGRTISLTISSYSSPKAYSIPADAAGSYGVFPLSNTSNVTSYSTAAVGAPGTGTVTVTSDANNRMKGTFSFNANKLMGSASAGSVSVTEGNFDVPKQ